MARTIQPAPRSGVSMLLPFIVLVVVIAAVILVAALMVLPEGNSSPEGVLEEYADASNERDTKRMLDQTVFCFTPGYEQFIPELEDSLFILDPEITIISSEILYKEDMNQDQEEYAQELIQTIELGMSVDVEDYCYIDSTYTLEYRALGMSQSSGPGLLCVLIVGDWYLALPTLILPTW